MKKIDETPLGQFRKKARTVAIASAVVAIVFAVLAGGLYASAQNDYADYLSGNSSDYDFSYLDDDDEDYYSTSAYSLASYSSDRAYSSYQFNSTGATFCMYIGVLASAVAGVSAIAWIGANLLIANKQTELTYEGAEANLAPMELDSYADAIKPAIGSTIHFNEIEWAVVAFTVLDKPAGELNREFSDRIKRLVKLDKAVGVVGSYHGDNPVIRIIR